IAPRTAARMISRSTLPYTSAADGRPSQSCCSAPGGDAAAGTTIPPEPPDGTAAATANTFPQCGHDMASVETCCPHSRHLTKAMNPPPTCGNSKDKLPWAEPRMCLQVLF